MAEGIDNYLAAPGQTPAKRIGTDVYQYVDRIQCWKNGEKPTGSSAQAYCFLVWDKLDLDQPTRLHWIRRLIKLTFNRKYGII